MGNRKQYINGLICTCCFLQFFVIGIINVIRGYSMETDLTHELLLIGIGIFIVYNLYTNRIRTKEYAFYSIVVSFILLFYLSANFHQGRDLKEAKNYYDRGQYPQALQSLKKETQTWYRRLRYNYHERSAMQMMAKTYCQLEDFDNARNTYKLIIDRYPGLYATHAKKDLIRLENGLQIVAKYPDQIPETEGVPVDLYNIARTYQYDLNCHTKAIEVYRKIVDMDIPDNWKELAIEHITELTRDVDE